VTEAELDAAATIERRVNLNIADVSRIATDAARLISPDLRVTGVVVSASGSEYAEVLVTIEGRWNESRRVAIGVRRKPSLAVLREQLAAKLSAVYRAYRDS
jgi:hypothetical protein